MAAEGFVSAALEAMGWVVAARNLRTPYAEIDILAQDACGHWVVVEVKARQADSWLQGEDCLGPNQLQRISRAMEWLANRQRKVQAVRLDLALVQLSGQQPQSWQLFKEILLYQ